MNPTEFDELSLIGLKLAAIELNRMEVSVFSLPDFEIFCEIIHQVCLLRTGLLTRAIGGATPRPGVGLCK